MDAIGTTDLDFLYGLMSGLMAVNDDYGEANERRLIFMLSVIKGLKPNTQLVAMLGAQMAVVHPAIMAYARRLLSSENYIQQDKAEGDLNRLTRTFTALVECLERVQARGPQMEQNSVDVGAQAVVANVTQPPTEPMPRGLLRQSHPLARRLLFLCP